MSNLSDMIEEVKLIAGIGRPVTDIQNVYSCLDEADYALMNRMDEKQSFCIFYNPENEYGIEVSSIIDIQNQRDILACQERLDVEGVKK